MRRDKFAAEQACPMTTRKPSMVQKIEAGDLNVLITTAIRLQRALKCPWERLLP